MPGPVVVLPESQSALFAQKQAAQSMQQTMAPLGLFMGRQLQSQMQEQFPTIQEQQQKALMQHYQVLSDATMERLRLEAESLDLSKKDRADRQRGIAHEQAVERFGMIRDALGNLTPASGKMSKQGAELQGELLQELAKAAREIGIAVSPEALMALDEDKRRVKLANLLAQAQLKVFQEYGAEEAQARIDQAKAAAAASDVRARLFAAQELGANIYQTGPGSAIVKLLAGGGKEIIHEQPLPTKLPKLPTPAESELAAKRAWEKHRSKANFDALTITEQENLLDRARQKAQDKAGFVYDEDIKKRIPADFRRFYKPPWEPKALLDIRAKGKRALQAQEQRRAAWNKAVAEIGGTASERRAFRQLQRVVQEVAKDAMGNLEAFKTLFVKLNRRQQEYVANELERLGAYEDVKESLSVPSG